MVDCLSFLINGSIMHVHPSLIVQINAIIKKINQDNVYNQISRHSLKNAVEIQKPTDNLHVLDNFKTTLTTLGNFLENLNINPNSEIDNVNKCINVFKNTLEEYARDNQTSRQWLEMVVCYLAALAIVCFMIAMMEITAIGIILCVIEGIIALMMFGKGTYLGLQTGYSADFYELANTLSYQQQLNEFGNSDAQLMEFVKGVKIDDAISYLKVFKQIDNAESILQLKNTEREYKAIQPWTYWGFFPLNPESMESQIEQKFYERVTEKYSCLQ